MDPFAPAPVGSNSLNRPTAHPCPAAIRSANRVAVVGSADDRLTLAMDGSRAITVPRSLYALVVHPPGPERDAWETALPHVIRHPSDLVATP